MKTYKATHVKFNEFFSNSRKYLQLEYFKMFDWISAEEASIDCFPWLSSTSSYQPNSSFRIFYQKDYLHILLLTQGKYEKVPRCEILNAQGSVNLDSCLEFYLAPYSNEKLYFNFEFNQMAIYRIAFGLNDDNRFVLDEFYLKNIHIQQVSSRDLIGISQFDWGIYLGIPFELIRQINNKLLDDVNDFEERKGFSSGDVFKINAYKCGDLTIKPHFGCWSPIICEQPNFRKTEFFGELILV